MAGKAESRLIYNSISTSERVSSLGVKGALLYTWLITHCDAQGRFQGKPIVIKHTVAPLLNEISIEDVEEALGMMHEQKLIQQYNDDKVRPLIQILDWWEWQVGLKYKPASFFQAPPGWEDKVTSRDDSGRFVKED
ncbi:hypothetical protein ACFLUH_01450 [Chloroflexota bacterium]